MDNPNLIAAISLVVAFALSVAGAIRIMESSHRPGGAILGAICIFLGLWLTIFGSLLFITPDPLNGAMPRTADPSAPAATRSAQLGTR
jgi:hypothetical protein